MKFDKIVLLVVLIGLSICSCNCNKKSLTKAKNLSLNVKRGVKVSFYFIREDLVNEDNSIVLFLFDNLNPIDTLLLTPPQAATAMGILNTGKAYYNKKLGYLTYTDNPDLKKAIK